MRNTNITIANAFSISMIANTIGGAVVFGRASLEDVRRVVADPSNTVVAAVGHADTASVFSGLLGVHVPASRRSVALERGTVLLVGQYTGPRLPEGATALPNGATIEWWWVSWAD